MEVNARSEASEKGQQPAPAPQQEEPAGPYRIVFTQPATLWASEPAFSRRDHSVDLPNNTKVHVEPGRGGFLRDEDNEPDLVFGGEAEAVVHAFQLSEDAEASRPLGWLDLSWATEFYRFRPEDVEFSMFDLLRPDGSVAASGRAALWIMKNFGRRGEAPISFGLKHLCARWTAQEDAREKLRLSGEFTFGDLEDMPISRIQSTWRRYGLDHTFQNCRDAYLEHARVIFDDDVRVVQLHWEEATQLLSCTNLGGDELAELTLGGPAADEARDGHALQALLAEEQGLKPRNIFLILPDGTPIERAQLDVELLELLQGQ